MPTYDLDVNRITDDQTADFSSQQGCDQLPAKKNAIARVEEFIEKPTAEIERIEGELRRLRGQPGSPERDRKLTPLGDALADLYNERGRATRRLSTLIEEVREFESRCTKKI